MRIESVRNQVGSENVTAGSNVDSNSNATGTGRAVSSNTPQTMLSGNEDYATAASDTVSDNNTIGQSTTESDSESNSEVDATSLVSGYQAAASDLINKYRASLLNIDTSIILEVQDCFMALLNNGDSYSQHNYPYYYGRY
jgi:hypothetical protein